MPLTPPRKKARKPLFADQARFLRSLVENPRLTGAVAPSGRYLAKAMARAAGAAGAEGLVIELGPGTGPVTAALLANGVPRESLLLVEFEPSFCRLLEQRFAPVRVIEGDAYALNETLRHLRGEKIRAIVSSLPLLNQPEERRAQLIEQAFAIMGPAGIFVQFTYGAKSPIDRETCAGRFSASVGAPIWRNLPPARVWTYRLDAKGAFDEPAASRLRSAPFGMAGQASAASVRLLRHGNVLRARIRRKIRGMKKAASDAPKTS